MQRFRRPRRSPYKHHGPDRGEGRPRLKYRSQQCSVHAPLPKKERADKGGYQKQNKKIE